MKVKTYNQTAQETGTVELPDAMFGLKWSDALVYQVVTSQVSNARQTVAHAKGRGEVRGGGRKPWKQKGTGRARHGSIRSPIWKGGGVAHGPKKEENFEKKINKKMAKKALAVVLSAKVRDNELVILDEISFSDAKTKLAAHMFANFSKKKEFENITKGNGALVIIPATSKIERRALKNLPFVEIEEMRNLNAHKVLQHRFMFVSKASLENLNKTS